MTATTTPGRAGATPATPTVDPLQPNGLLRDTSIVFRRQIRMNLRNPAWVLIGIMQPVLYLVLFGPLLRPLVSSFDLPTDNPYTFLVPGLLVQLGMFGAFFAGFGLIAEWREGVVEAERVTPASRAALLLGRLTRDLTLLLVQALILVGLGYWMGMRGDVLGVVAGIVITLAVGGACAAASNALALTTKSEDVMAPLINMVMMPVLLLSGIMLPMTLGPAWLETTSDFMPFRWITDAVRGTFVGDFGSSGVAWGVAWALALLALGLWWGTSVFRKENS
ncbi:ABC transporter permease [Nocardioides zeae]|uniref:Transport permease protein n=1 Tax=Nocardioides imazamoxiresistens TaxID=3231893 RepID=A0ABU3PWF2_9ACTN|nr:ABC transporter permease [Nocardioides zeae]MDT9593157.1 ABC transporter permease [Nocardioides zeae]